MTRPKRFGVIRWEPPGLRREDSPKYWIYDFLQEGPLEYTATSSQVDAVNTAKQYEEYYLDREEGFIDHSVSQFWKELKERR